MEYRKLSNSDLKVSRFALGCMGFGDSTTGMHTWTLGYDESKKIIKAAIDKEINFFDTAIACQNGSSEKIVGKALRELLNRDDYILATKFLPRSKEEIKNNISIREHINKSLDTSLKNLGLDYFDLYIYHMRDYNSDYKEIMRSLDELVNSGKIRYIGISNSFTYQLQKANFYAKENNLAQFISMQGHYNLIHREEEREMIPFCKEENIALTPYSSLASGRLAKLNSNSKRRKEDQYANKKYDKTKETDQEIIKRVDELAKKYNTSMTAISLSWLLEKVDSPIVGATKISHLDGLREALDIKLNDKDLKYLEEKYIAHDLVGVMASNK